jgi:hypothetical protein
LTATVHATPPLSLAALVATKNSPKARAARAARAAPGAIRRPAAPLGVVLDGDQRAAADRQGEADRDQRRRALAARDAEGDRDDRGQRRHRRHNAHRADGQAAVEGGEAEHLAQPRARGDGHRLWGRRRLSGQREEHEQEQEPGPLREDQEGEHRQAPRDQTGQEVGASPRDARPERQSESDHAPGA